MSDDQVEDYKEALAANRKSIDKHSDELEKWATHTAEVAAMVVQQYLDADEDQIVNCVFCFTLWMSYAAKRACFVHYTQVAKRPPLPMLHSLVLYMQMHGRSTELTYKPHTLGARPA